MHRIDHPTRAIDGNGPGKDGFTPGDPVTQVAATVVTSDWCNAIQEEIASAIQLAGLPLDKGNNGQLAAAIAALTEAPEAPPAVRTTYLFVPDFRGPWIPYNIEGARGWLLNENNTATALTPSARLRMSVPIPSGATIHSVEAAVEGPAGMKLSIYRETPASGVAMPTQGPRATDTSVQGSQVLAAHAIATQDKTTSLLILELLAGPSGSVVGWAGYCTLYWARFTWGSAGTVTDR